MRIRTTIAATAAGGPGARRTGSRACDRDPDRGARRRVREVDFTVPNERDGSAGTSRSGAGSRSVPSATPQVHPGWSLETETESPEDEVELFGETITEGVSEVIWTGEEAPLPDGYLEVFGLEVKLPATEGETIVFPVIQSTRKGAIRWIGVPAEGETEDDLESPAPAVVLTAAEESEHGGDAQADAAGEESAEAERAGGRRALRRRRRLERARDRRPRRRRPRAVDGRHGAGAVP